MSRHTTLRRPQTARDNNRFAMIIPGRSGTHQHLRGRLASPALRIGQATTEHAYLRDLQRSNRHRPHRKYSALGVAAGAEGPRRAHAGVAGAWSRRGADRAASRAVSNR